MKKGFTYWFDRVCTYAAVHHEEVVLATGVVMLSVILWCSVSAANRTCELDKKVRELENDIRLLETAAGMHVVKEAEDAEADKD